MNVLSVKGEYCPRCGAQKVELWRTAMGERPQMFRCAHCGIGYADSLEGRWDARWYSAHKWPQIWKPVEGLENPHNWRQRREEIRQLVRDANGKKCRQDATGNQYRYYGRCGMPFEHEGKHRHVED